MRANRINDILTHRFAPERLDVVDQSALHAGHSGARPEGETHFAVTMVAACFEGRSRVARSRAVHEALEGEFSAGLHALALRLLTPAEANRAAP